MRVQAPRDWTSDKLACARTTYQVIQKVTCNVRCLASRIPSRKKPHNGVVIGMRNDNLIHYRWIGALKLTCLTKFQFWMFFCQIDGQLWQ